MRRILNAAWNHVGRKANEIEQGWDRFWFTPADPTLLGVIRILAGLMLVYTHCVWGLQLESFFGPDAWLTRELVETMQQNQVAWSFWWYVPQNLIWPVHYVSVTILALFTLGVATRLTSILSFVIVVSYIYRTPCALFGLDQINTFLTLYCCLGPAGATLSIDSWLKRRRAAGQSPTLATQPERSVMANVSLRLIQVQMCLIYFFAGISKLLGAAWWNGDAMWLAFSNFEYQSTDMTWLVRYPWVTQLMTHATIAWELTFWALVWKPLWRPLMLAMSVALHVGIGLCLGMWTFGLIMLVGCASFLPEEFVRWMVDGLSGAVARLAAKVGWRAARATQSPTSPAGWPELARSVVASPAASVPSDHRTP